MGEQTAIRRGDLKLVLRGQLVEHAPHEDNVHPADFSVDPSERENLTAQRPELAEEMKAAAGEWRAESEARWEREFSPKDRVRHPE